MILTVSSEDIMVAKKEIPIDRYLDSILKNNSFNNFTVTQLRDAYASSANISNIEARKVIYRQILRFLHLGLFKKEQAVNARESKYSKTAKFLNTQFKPRSLKCSPKVKMTQPPTSVGGLNKIKEQLKQYKVDLLASVGESEEYMSLYESNPELKILLESEYHLARDQSSKLLGQIKALNTVLSHYSN